MKKINIKPLSVNEAWKGRKFKTKEYKQYEQHVMYLLPKKIELYDKMKIQLEFGFSSRASDWDNPVKPFVDILQKVYGFDDNLIYEGIVKKKLVPKGKEYVSFKLSKFESI